MDELFRAEPVARAACGVQNVCLVRAGEFARQAVVWQGFGHARHHAV